MSPKLSALNMDSCESNRSPQSQQPHSVLSLSIRTPSSGHLWRIPSALTEVRHGEEPLPVLFSLWEKATAISSFTSVQGRPASSFCWNRCNLVTDMMSSLKRAYLDRHWGSMKYTQSPVWPPASGSRPSAENCVSVLSVQVPKGQHQVTVSFSTGKVRTLLGGNLSLVLKLF